MRFYIRLLAYGRAWYSNLGLAFGALLLYNVFSAASFSLFIPFLEILFSDAQVHAEPPQGLAGAQGLKAWGYYYLYRAIEELGRSTTLVYFCLAMGTAILLKNFFRYASAFLLAPLEHGILRNLRNRLFDHLTRMSLGYYTRQRKGYLVNVNTSDLQNVHEAVVGTVMPLVSDPLTMVIFLGAMLFISWKLTLFTLVVLPVTALVIGRISGSLKRKAVKGQTTLDNLMSLLDEFFGGIRIVKAFGAEGYINTKYRTLNQEYTSVMVRFRRQVEWASPITEFLAVLVILSIIIYGGQLILAGQSDLKASEFLTFIIFFSQFITPVKTLSQAFAKIQKSRVSFERVEALLAEPIQTTEAPGGTPAVPLERAIELKDVTFGYDSTAPVLRGVSLTVYKGETVALVGPSGGGKSTLLDLICRFYDVQGGQILYDGADIRSLDAPTLRHQMGIVSQEGILFNDTVRSNIAYGNPAYTDAQIEAAARVANADGFIRALPEGYNTVLGERGMTLSGGQRQRISIARAVLKNPPILILDEATSALDSENERLVQAALERLMEGRTSVVVAHRLSTIVRADRIVVVQEGQVVETGTHTELLARGGKYAELYRLQFAAAEGPQ